eukprot:COSAG02_NODE_16232_length_1101_cov_1.520958_2_plen_195_part_01
MARRAHTTCVHEIATTNSPGRDRPSHRQQRLALLPGAGLPVPMTACRRRLQNVNSHLAIPAKNSRFENDLRSLHGCSGTSAVAEVLPPDGLFRPGWEQAFDDGTWERNGVLVLPNVLTDVARELWLASLQRLQRISDTIIRETPWSDAEAWAPLGLVPTRPPLSDAEKDRLCGGCEIGGPDGGFFQPGFNELPFE